MRSDRTRATGCLDEQAEARCPPYSSDLVNRTRRRLMLGLLGLVGAAAVAAGGIRMKQVQNYGWEWTLFPSVAPPKLRFQGRDYDRGASRPERFRVAMWSRGKPSARERSTSSDSTEARAQSSSLGTGRAFTRTG